MLDDAMLERHAWHGAPNLRTFTRALSLVGKEIKRAVFLNRTTEAAPERVSQQARRRILLTAGQLGAFVEIIVSDSVGWPVVFVSRAVNGGSSPLGDQRHLSARAPPFA